MRGIPRGHRGEIRNGLALVFLVPGFQKRRIGGPNTGGRVIAGGHDISAEGTDIRQFLVRQKIMRRNDIDPRLAQTEILDRLHNRCRGWPCGHPDERHIRLGILDALHERRIVGRGGREADRAQHLAAGIRKALDESAFRIMARNEIGHRGEATFPSLLPRPRADRQGGLPEREGETRHIRRNAGNGDATRIGDDERDFGFRRQRRDGRRDWRGDDTHQHLHAFAGDQFLRNPLADLRRSSVIAADELHLDPGRQVLAV